MKSYRQCRLTRGSAETTAWIETRGATVGASVQLLPEDEFWQVAAVYPHTMAEDMLKEHQRLHRKSLTSIEPMAPAKKVGGL